MGRVALLLAIAGVAAVAAATAGARSGPACTAASTRALLREFVTAFNAGDGQRLDGSFATGDRFRWFSSGAPGPRVSPDAGNRSSLLPYFAWRHALGDRLRIVSVRWNGNSSGGAFSYGNVSFVLDRGAADFQHGSSSRVPGKAAALCEGAAPQFIVMSLGAPAILRAPLPKRWTWRQLHRPLRLPTLAPDDTCPTTPPAGPRLGIWQQFGLGPSYPGLAYLDGVAVAEVTPPTDPAQPYAGWLGTKLLWRTPRRGPVLVRGARLDAAGMVGFDLGPGWTWSVHDELRLTGPESDWHPAATFVHEPGCYAYQIDTPRYSSLVVFEARVQ